MNALLDVAAVTKNFGGLRAVDGQPLPGCPGPLTKAASDAYAALLSADPDPG